MTVERLIEALNGKIEPLNQAAGRLWLSANGQIVWLNSAEAVNAEKLIIGDKEYAVRTGTAGADGFLTIGANNIWLGRNEVNLDLGGKQVVQIFAGATSIYSAASGSFRVYYNGDQNGITWRGNYLPRPNYTQYGVFSLANENVGAGYLHLSVSNHSSAYVHNAHVMTRQAVKVPARATTMHCYCRAESDSPINIRFGLLPINAPTSYSTANGGALSAETAISGTTWRDLTLTLPAAVKGADNLYPIVNARGEANADRSARIAWIWFD